jgi:hypothetical protein
MGVVVDSGGFSNEMLGVFPMKQETLMKKLLVAIVLVSVASHGAGAKLLRWK